MLQRRKYQRLFWIGNPKCSLLPISQLDVNLRAQTLENCRSIGVAELICFSLHSTELSCEINFLNPCPSKCTLSYLFIYRYISVYLVRIWFVVYLVYYISRFSPQWFSHEYMVLHSVSINCLVLPNKLCYMKIEIFILY